jgi:hypothetical protein
MPLPKMTKEQQQAALKKAAEARAKRAKLKEDIKAGKISLKEIFDSEDAVVKKTKVTAVLGALPGYGKVSVTKLMEECGIQDNRRIGGLGSNQKAMLLEKTGK